MRFIRSKRKFIFIQLIVTFLIVITMSSSLHSGSTSDLTPEKRILISSQPIKIDGNSDFEAKAITEGWTGNGTVSSPILIEGLSITSASDTLIDISNTDIYFLIRNCDLEGSFGVNIGINLKNVKNAQIEDNNLMDFQDGLYTEDCDEVEIMRNHFSNSKYGARVENSFNFLIHGNDLFNNEIAGLRVANVQSQINGYHVISNNHVYDNLNWGINIHYSFYNVIKNNIISNNAYHGLYLSQAQSSEFINNTIKDSGWDGVKFSGGGGKNDFFMNQFENNGFYGLNLFYTGNNKVKFNRFIGNSWNNSQATSQAYDDNSVTSTYAHIWDQNFWDDWTSPDADNDGFVDIPYSIDGDGNREDTRPLVSFKHEVTEPTLISPLDGASLNGTVEIKWEQSEDNFHHMVTYSVAYSNDDGTSWTELISDQPSTRFNWDTTAVSDGSDYQIRVIALCEYGITSDSTSENITIKNESPAGISTPSLGFLITLLIIGLIITFRKRRKAGAS